MAEIVGIVATSHAPGATGWLDKCEPQVIRASTSLAQPATLAEIPASISRALQAIAKSGCEAIVTTIALNGRTNDDA